MSPDPATTILTLTNTQAKELAGRLVTIGSESYCFKDYDRDRPGQPPWRSGAEGKAFPLLGLRPVGRRLPEVLHPPDGEAVGPDDVADRAADARLAA